MTTLRNIGLESEALQAAPSKGFTWNLLTIYAVDYGSVTPHFDIDNTLENESMKRLLLESLKWSSSGSWFAQLSFITCHIPLVFIIAVP